MASLEDDEDFGASSDNDVDENMDEDEDAVDQTLDMDAEAENEEDNDDNEDDDDQDDTQDVPDDTPTRPRPKPYTQDKSSASDKERGGEENGAANGTKVDFTGVARSPHRTGAVRATAAPFRPVVRAEAIAAGTYDIVPTIAAPHSTSINAVTATPDMRWVFSGGSDGWVRKFNWIETANAKTLLTVAQRHPFVDSVTKCGVLMSYWENEETPYKEDAPPQNPEDITLSPVHSLAVHHQGLWLLSGTETGIINLQAIRHEEGKRILSLNQHSSAVSVMKLSQDETSLLSGSWDKSIFDWDLNTGQIKRSFTGSGSQISAVELRPESNLPIPRETMTIAPPSATLTSNNAERPARGSVSSGLKHSDSRRESAVDVGGSEGDSLFGGNDNDSLFGDDEIPVAGGALPGYGEDEGYGGDGEGFDQPLTNGVQEKNLMDGDGDVGMSDMNGLDEPLFGEQAQSPTQEGPIDEGSGVNGDAPTSLPHAEDVSDTSQAMKRPAEPSPPPPTSESTFLDAAIDGTLRIWDRRQPNPIVKIVPPRSVPPWCMHACWSPDGNFIYAGRRNGTVEEYSLHKGLHEPHRTLKFPAGSGSVSALCAMPNGRHLVCASYDILRLYDLKDEESAKHSKVPFLIVPGHRTGVVSQLYMDPTCTFMISTGGNRGWEGNSTEVLLGYEVGLLN